MAHSMQYSRDLSVAHASNWRDHWRMARFHLCMRTLVLTCLALWTVSPAAAHPHVMVEAKAVVVHAPDGSITAIRHTWVFDEAYSVYAVQGLDKNNDGKLTGDELAELAKVNVESLGEFGFFTVARANGVKQVFADPVDYALSFEKNILTLTFTLPLKAPATAIRTFGLEVSDPTWFVSFALAQGDNAVVLKDAPKGCTTTLTRPKPADVAAKGTLGEDYFTSGAGAKAGLQFVNRALIACP